MVAFLGGYFLVFRKMSDQSENKAFGKTLKILEFDGVNIDRFCKQFERFIGGTSFGCWEILFTEVGTPLHYNALPITSGELRII